ncbi:MAG: hypothetical protein ABIN95_02555 [Mucilaginibacter sp.]
MKTLIVIFLIIGVAVAVPVEKYYVTFIKGEVLLERTKKPVKVGDALNPDDKLVFKDKTGRVSCISPGKGRFDITAQSVKPGKGGELLAILKASLVPATGTYHLSTRSILSEGYDPVTYFSSEATHDRILLISDEPLPIKPSYVLDAGNFFFIQFTENGKPVTRKVPYTQHGLVFSEKLFLTSAGIVAERVTLGYQSNTDGERKSSAVAVFSPVTAGKEEIIQQVKLISDITGTTDKKKQKAEIIDHLFENYGKIDTEELARVFGI